ncbi:restriction endonuclease [Lacisediminimonas profundi]|uniref:restriction endonuclease n=1 Tax=Lacisediminimonas profundi TaxID=2603856 RepID=UPI00124B4F59|nr:restriction endonuclease [Lacisediminimonas profundi]
MGRKKSSGAEDLMHIVAMCPWWVGVALAIVSYVVLHKMSLAAPPATLQPGQLGGPIIGMMLTALASFGKYLLPLICLAGAALSIWERKRRRGLVAAVTHKPAAAALDGMSWREFEMLVGEAFRLQGYRVTETGGSGPDGGVDLILNRGSETFLVQCKQWKSYKVGVGVVRELYGVMAAKGVAGGIVVTSGDFTDDAKVFAAGRHVKLVDGGLLFGLITQAQESLAGRGRAAMPATRATGAAVEPLCPICASAMVSRTARKGVNAGREFWGCTGYPACRGTRQSAD